MLILQSPPATTLYFPATSLVYFSHVSSKKTSFPPQHKRTLAHISATNCLSYIEHKSLGREHILLQGFFGKQEASCKHAFSVLYARHR